jgi:DNA-binding CsgD family transcriptional regulator
VSLPDGFENRCGECALFGAIQGLIDGLVLVDLQGCVVHMNQRAEEILEVTGLHVHGSSLRACIKHQGLAAFWAAASKETDPVTAELELPPRVTLRATASLSVGLSGAPIGRLLLLRDVTREKTIQIELSSAVAQRLVRMAGDGDVPAELPPLTRREREILGLVAGGLSNAAIAARLQISTNTVASHLKHLYAKLKVTSRSQAAAFALTRGLRPPAA